MTDREPRLPRPELEYLAALCEGRFMIQRCTGTGRHVFYPRTVSPWTGRPTLEWVEASGRGTVYSTTVIRQKPERGGDYNVAIVDLAEDVRLMTAVIDIAPDAVRIGMPVVALVETNGESPRVVFRPAPEPVR